MAATGAADDGTVAIRWSAAGDTLRSVQAQLAAHGWEVGDTLATRVACP